MSRAAGCPHGGGPRRLLAAILDPSAITKVLGSLGLPADPPEIAPPGRRRPDQASLRVLIARGAVAQAEHLVHAAEAMEYGCLEALVEAGVNPVAELGNELLDEISADPEVAKRLR